MDIIEEKLREINDKLDQALALLKDAKLRPLPPPREDLGLDVGGISTKEDGTTVALFRVCGDPRQWSSGKGAFYSCKVEGDPAGSWYSVAITNNVADKVQPGWRPEKGDLISVRGKYEEKIENGKTYRSVFAFTVKPDGSLPQQRTTPQQNDEYGDVPF